MSTFLLFNTIDGSLYFNLFDQFDPKELQNFLKQNRQEILEVDKFRVVFQNCSANKKVHLKKILIDFYLQYKTKIDLQDYKTNFFYFPKDKLAKTLENPELNWKNLASDFDYFILDDKPAIAEVLVLENFLVHSFGQSFTIENDKLITTDHPKRIQKIRSKLTSTIKKPNVFPVLVATKNKNWVGAFCLVRAGNELQLHSVGGFAKFLPVYKGSKLKVIAASAFEIWQKEFGGNFELTLSSSKPKIDQKYYELGFEINSTKQGFIIKKN